MSKENIKIYFLADHDRLDGLFKKFQELKRVDFPTAKECFKEFKSGLQRHIVWEEEILFPENILYPAIDRSMSDEEKAYVFTAMKNIPEERYQFCCKET